MKKKDIQSIDLNRIVDLIKPPHIGSDIALLTDLRSIPKLDDARRMSLCLVVILCTDGVASLVVNEKKRIVSRNSILVVTDDSVVNSINYSDDFNGVGFVISYQMVQEILSGINNMRDIFLLVHNHPCFEVNDKEREAVVVLYHEILKRMDVNSRHRYRLEVVKQLILAIIYDLGGAFDRILKRAGNEDRQSRAEIAFVQFVQMVEHHFREQRQVQWYAKQMDMTPKYLCEVVSGVSRRSPNEWIDRFVCAEIRNQLRQTNKKISEIAEEMHFPTQSFFGKYFKENVGVSPSDYRNGIEK